MESINKKTGNFLKNIALILNSKFIEPNSIIDISWFYKKVLTNVKIEYYFNDTWNEISTVAANSLSYSWSVPYFVFGTSKMRISDAGNPSISDEMNIEFAMSGIKLTTTKSDTLLGLIEPSVSQLGTIYYLNDNTREDFSGSRWSISKTYSDSLAKDILILTDKYDFYKIDFKGQNIENYLKYKSVDNRRLELQNNNLSSLDVTDNTTLRRLELQDNNLSELDVTNNAELYRLVIQNNNLDQLDVTNNTILLYLRCDNNNLSELNLTNNTALEFLYCDNNNISSISFNGQLLDNLWAYSNDLGVLDFGNTDLQDGCSIRLRDNNMTASEVDENLVKIATQATAGSRAYDVEIHGTNAAATDGTITGFDGKQAILDIRAENGTVVESGGF